MSDHKYVYFFGEDKTEGNAGMRNLLGGKGSHLAEMANQGIPVPQGFTLTTEVCTAYYNHQQHYPDGVKEQVAEQQASEVQAQKDSILRQILSPEARSRLTNIKMVKPQVAEQIELQLIQLASSGRLKGRVSDEQLKALLQQIMGRERERKVTFR